jgi:hypothetical protein
MEHYGIMLTAILVTMAASLAATALGYWLAGFALFIMAATPLPLVVAYRLRDLVRVTPRKSLR